MSCEKENPEIHYNDPTLKEVGDRNPKKAYSAPSLQVFGSLAQLIRGQGGSQDDFAGEESTSD